MLSTDHLASPSLLAWCSACIPGFAAAAAPEPIRAFVRSTGGPRPGAAIALTPIDRVRRGVQPFAR